MLKNARGMLEIKEKIEEDNDYGICNQKPNVVLRLSTSDITTNSLGISSSEIKCRTINYMI